MSDQFGLKDQLRRWQLNILTTVDRVTGMKRGTARTDGTSYLRKLQSVHLFADLWRVRTVF